MPLNACSLLLIGELSFQEYEKRIRDVNTDYSNVSVGKVLDTRETDIIDIDKLIDELSDIDDLSGLSSSDGDSASKTSDNSDNEKKTSKKRKNDSSNDNEVGEEDDDDNDDDDNQQKIMDPNKLRNKMVQHLEEMRLAKQKLKRSTKER
jgi:hypothetical protein